MSSQTHTDEEVAVRCADGAVLAGTFYPAAPARAAVLLAPAMGVPRAFYTWFARFLARQGLAVLSIDYRGIGASLTGSVRDCPALLHEWGELDLPAGAGWLSARLPGAPLLFVGHSVGGQILGLATGIRPKAALFLGSQSGYWKGWDGLTRAAMFAVWYAAIPLATALTGKLPMRRFGQGQDLPKGVAREWARWGRDPRYVGSYATGKPGLLFETFSGRILSCAIADDRYAPRRSVEALLPLYRAAQKELRVLEPARFQAEAIGHFGLFRQRFEGSIWPELAEWLLAQA